MVESILIHTTTTIQLRF